MLNWLFASVGNQGFGGWGSGYGMQNNYWNNPQPVVTPPNHYSEERLHSLELACAALWELLKQKNGYTDDELKSIIQGMGAQRPADPTLGDPNLTQCPKCHHKLLTHNHTKCLWCGADIAGSPL